MRQSVRVFAMTAACALLTIFGSMAGASYQDENKRDMEAMQGIWVCQKWVNAGESALPDKVAQLVMTFKGNQVVVGAKPGAAAVITIDATRTPPSMDFIDSSQKVDRGIYKLDGDTLTFCMALSASGKDRPTVFESTKDNGFMLVVLRRQARINSVASLRHRI